MRILVIGSGGREHALAWKLAQSPAVEKLYIAPGNSGTAQEGENVAIGADDIAGLVEFAKNNRIDLVVPGPELPLSLGIGDELAKNGIACFGPDKYCARLEASKSFAKEIMDAAGVPTAKSRVFTDAAEARQWIEAGPERVVIKADGLAAGKGVVVCDNHAEACAAVEMMLSKGQFGAAGAKVLVEERLEGEEVSLLCLCAGEVAKPLSSAQDHKAAFDHDQGPNTGGMGAYSPAPVLPDAALEEMADRTVRPVLRLLAGQGHPFTGVLYAGLMLTADGPKVLEYNVRFGDPECQPLMLRLTSDLAHHLRMACAGRLADEEPVFSSESALGVVLASAGYPGDYEKDLPVSGIADAESAAGVKVFHAGLRQEQGALLSNGGRVLCVTARGRNLPRAQDNAYVALGRISMPKSRFRRDIGAKGLLRLGHAGQ